MPTPRDAVDLVGTVPLKGVGPEHLRDKLILPAHLSSSLFGASGQISTIDPDDAAAAGATGLIADAGHQHPFTSAAATDIGITNSEGSASTHARSDHGHKALGQLIVPAITVAGAAAQSVTFSSIPSGFNNLFCVFDATSDVGTDVVRDVDVRFNADSGANYHSQTNRDGTFAQSLSDTGIKLTEIDGSAAGRPASGEFTVINYLENTKARIVTGSCFSLQTGSIVDFRIIGTWNNTANAITSLTLTTSNAATKFAVGSKFWLYGI